MKITFSEQYDQQNLVEDIVDQWKSGARSFSLKSSGTTGTEKEISLSRELLEWSIRQTTDTFNLAEERVLCCLPVNKAAGFMQLMRAVQNNWDIHFDNPSSAPLSNLPLNHKYTLVSMSPLQIADSIENYSQQLSKFNTVLIGGVAIDPQLELDLINWNEKFPFCELIVTYGSAETASHIAYRGLGEEYYTLINGVNISIHNSRFSMEIPAINFNHLSTDIAEIKDGRFRILGRIDDVINSGGIKINVQQTQAQLEEVLKIAGIKRKFYLGQKADRKLGHKLVLVFEGSPIKDEDFLLQLLKRELPLYHAPKEFKYLDKFQYTDTGKLKRLIPA